MYTSLTESAWRGWRERGFPHGSWRVVDGVLQAVPGASPVSLVSRDRYTDFDLSLQWRLPAGSSSGIFYRVIEDVDEPWQSGPEFQLLGGEGHPDSRRPETSCGALYELYEADDVPPCPAGLFNIARLCVTGARVEHWLNGRSVLSVDMASEGFRNRVARSRFRNHPGFARSPEGHIVLQHHGTAAEFYDIRIETP